MNSSWGMIPINLKTVIPLYCIESIESLTLKSSKGRQFRIMSNANMSTKNGTNVNNNGGGNNNSNSVSSRNGAISMNWSDSGSVTSELWSSSPGGRIKSINLRAEDAQV